MMAASNALDCKGRLASDIVQGRGMNQINLSRVLGRRRTMTIGGALFIIGAALQAGAVHLAMLIIGRVMLGLGVGLANQVRSPRSLQC